MNIPLSDDLRITGGVTAWEIRRHKVVKGVERWEAFKWFPKLGQALGWAGTEEIRLSEGDSLADAIEAFSRVSLRYTHLLDDALTEVAKRGQLLKRERIECRDSL